MSQYVIDTESLKVIELIPAAEAGEVAVMPSGILDRIRDRRERRQETEGRRTLMTIAAQVYEEGDTPATLRPKMLQALEESGESRPFLKILMALLEKLLPLLLQMLAGA